MFQGWTYPVPDDDMMPCEGLGSPISKHSNDDFNFVDADRPLAAHSPTQPVCRAVTGSEPHLGYTATLSAGDIALQTADQYTGELYPTFEGEHSTTGRPEQPNHSFDERSQRPQSASTTARRAPDGLTYLSILGGAPTGTWTATSQATQNSGMQNYAASTDCILQNLTMVVGNPSLRCLANAPWRAFTWVCALLQETSTHPWHHPRGSTRVT